MVTVTLTCATSREAGKAHLVEDKYSIFASSLPDGTHLQQPPPPIQILVDSYHFQHYFQVNFLSLWLTPCQRAFPL